MTKNVLLLFLIFFTISHPAAAGEACAADNTPCLFSLLEDQAAAIAEDQWRDNTYRELAKLLTHEKQTARAIALIAKIKNPDTKAMTIRGIGMAAADGKWAPEEYAALFTQLLEEAAKIAHPPSHAIALTYVSMAQAFAGDNEGAMKTAAAMENAALRNKAYGEAGEIQAARGEIDAVMKSVSAIDDPGYRDKEFRLISKIFTDGKYIDHALFTAEKIQNAYQKAQAILYILTKKITPEEVSIE